MGGGAEGSRTPDLKRAMLALYQLSYSPTLASPDIGHFAAAAKPLLPPWLKTLGDWAEIPYNPPTLDGQLAQR